MTKNESLLYSGLYLIAQADDGMQTVMLKKAIEELQAIINVRENIPF